MMSIFSTAKELGKTKRKDSTVLVGELDDRDFEVGVLNVPEKRLEQIASLYYESPYSPYVCFGSYLSVGKSTKEGDVNLLTVYSKRESGLIVPLAALYELWRAVSWPDTRLPSHDRPIFVLPPYSVHGIERMKSYNFEIVDRLHQMVRDNGPVEVAGPAWSLRQIGIQVPANRKAEIVISTVKLEDVSISQNMKVAGFEEAWDSAQYVVDMLLSSYDIPFSIPGDSKLSDVDPPTITKDIARLIREGQGDDPGEIAAEVVGMDAGWDHHLLAVRILVRILDLHGWRLAAEGDYESKTLTRKQLLAVIEALKPCSNFDVRYVLLRVGGDREGKSLHKTRFHYDYTGACFIVSPRPRLSETGFYVTYRPWQMWVYLTIGVAILVVYFALRVRKAPLEDVFQTLMFLLVLYATIPGAFLMKSIFKKERLSDVLRGRRNIDTKEEYDKLSTQEKWKGVLAMAQGERGESQNISSFGSGCAIVGSSKQGWATIPSFVFAREAELLGYEFGVSASGDLCYRRIGTKEAVVVKQEDNEDVHITERKAIDVIFDTSERTPLKTMISLLQARDRVGLASLIV